MTNSNLAKIAVSKSLLKEYSVDGTRSVYMNSGTEFQIQLFNDHQDDVACKVFINGEPMSNMIVIRPGERIWLERFTDRAQKFLFETYRVDDNADIRHAIEFNGDITIEFYDRMRTREITVTSDRWNNTPIWVSSEQKWFDNYFNNSGVSLKSSFIPDVSTSSCLNSSVNYVSTASDGCFSTASSTLETGRVTEGSHSKQEFEQVNYDFYNYPFRTEKIKILPLSQKPIHKEDLQKRYCPECGRKVVEKYKFCPYCGNKL